MDSKHSPGVEASRILLQLGRFIRKQVLDGRKTSTLALNQVNRVSHADEVYELDVLAENGLHDFLNNAFQGFSIPVHWIMEGLDKPQHFGASSGAGHQAWSLIVDPVDGTRCLMYDKRSAWVLSAMARHPHERVPMASDMFAWAMVEIPVTRQFLSSELVGYQDETIHIQAQNWNQFDGGYQAFTPQPSTATDLRGGFSSLVNFFPEGSRQLGKVADTFYRETGYLNPQGNPLLFMDQYLSTGGQLYELMVGHDRMIVDFRPEWVPGESKGLSCHPYDICCFPLLEALGGIVLDPQGKRPEFPLDTTTPVSWAGFANPTLAQKHFPALQKALKSL